MLNVLAANAGDSDLLGPDPEILNKFSFFLEAILIKFDLLNEENKGSIPSQELWI